jgi:hypothetical protein
MYVLVVSLAIVVIVLVGQLRSTAILTWAHQFSIVCVDSNNNPTGPVVLLQNRSSKPRKTRGRIDITNCMSPPGKAEFVPGVLHGQISIAGVVDKGVGFDTLFTAAMDTPFLTNSIFYYCKPTGANNPLQYAGLTMWENVELDFSTDAEGKAAMFTGEGHIVGGFVKSGTDVVYVTGATS